MFFKKNKNFTLGLSVAVLLASLFAACVKTTFDDPPVGGDGRDIQTNTSIRDLKTRHETSGGFDFITEDLIVGGVVTMDDRSGNYYKTIVIQDSTGGIEVKFNTGYLYNRYPVGRKIYIHCKGMYLTDYNDLIQLTGSTITENGQVSDVGISEAQERSNIVRGFLGAKPVPVAVTSLAFTPDQVSTLIRLDGVEFTKADTAQTWADAVTKSSINRTLENCLGQKVLLRTSGYSDFATLLTPGGKGSVTGVLGIYSGTYQFYIRDTSDVQLSGSRCGTGGGPETLVNISDIRSLFTGATTLTPPGKKIRGIVISDRVGNNLNSKNIYIQDGSAGIVVRFTAAHTFNLGDELEISISESELSEFNKLLQINNLDPARATLKSSGNTVTPRVATIAEITANFNAWESTLVKISNCTITPAGTLSGSKTANDGTQITLFTSSSATFASTPVPGVPVTLTAIVSDFNGKQILLRNASDIQQ